MPPRGQAEYFSLFSLCFSGMRRVEREETSELAEEGTGGRVIFPIRAASYCEPNFSYKHIESLDLWTRYR